MKQSQLKSLIKIVIHEICGEAHPDDSPTAKAIDTNSPLYKLGNQLTILDNKIRSIKKWTPEHIQLEDERMKVWWELRKHLGMGSNLKENKKEEEGEVCRRCGGTGEVHHSRYGTPSCPSETCKCPECEGVGIIFKEDHGLGFGHNVTWPTSTKQKRDPLNDPMLKEELPHPYKISLDDIAKDLVSKAARIRDEYHMSYEEAMKSVMMNLQNKISKISKPPERFPATGTRHEKVPT